MKRNLHSVSITWWFPPVSHHLLFFLKGDTDQNGSSCLDCIEIYGDGTKAYM